MTGKSDWLGMAPAGTRPCPQCKGSGWDKKAGETCSACGGFGY